MSFHSGMLQGGGPTPPGQGILVLLLGDSCDSPWASKGSEAAASLLHRVPPRSHDCTSHLAAQWCVWILKERGLSPGPASHILASRDCTSGESGGGTYPEVRFQRTMNSQLGVDHCPRPLPLISAMRWVACSLNRETISNWRAGLKIPNIRKQRQADSRQTAPA